MWASGVGPKPGGLRRARPPRVGEWGLNAAGCSGIFAGEGVFSPEGFIEDSPPAPLGGVPPIKNPPPSLFYKRGVLGVFFPCLCAPKYIPRGVVFFFFFGAPYYSPLFRARGFFSPRGLFWCFPQNPRVWFPYRGPFQICAGDPPFYLEGGFGFFGGPTPILGGRQRPPLDWFNWETPLPFPRKIHTVPGGNCSRFS